MNMIFVCAQNKDFSVNAATSLLSERFGARLVLKKKGALDNVSGAIFEADNLSDDTRLKIREEVAAATLGFDVWISSSFPTLKQNGIVVLDMDMTSVQIEGIDEIARRLGVYEEVASVTAQAMHGGLDFAQSLTKRVAMLKGGSACVIEDVKKIMHETEGLDVLMHTVSEASWKKGICSGGFVQLISVLQKKYALDMVCANSLEIRDGILTGQVDSEIVDAMAKRLGVLRLASENSVSKEQIIVLGDGANDLLMIEEAGLGIAYHAKPLVRQKAPFALNYSSLAAVALMLKLNS